MKPLRNKDAHLDISWCLAQRELLRAVVTGDIDAVRRITPASKALDSLGTGILEIAAANGHIDIVRYLVEQRAALVERKLGALSLAIFNLRTEVTAYLLDSLGRTPQLVNRAFSLMSQAGDLASLQALWVGDPQPDVHHDADAAVRFAARRGHLDVVKWLVANGANIESAKNPVALDAIRSGNLDVVRFVIETGAYHRPIIDELVTAAAETGNIALFKYVMQMSGRWPENTGKILQRAAELGDLKTIVRMHRAGADVSDAGEALLAAASNGHLMVVIYLHRNGVNINHENGAALRLAALSGHSRVAWYLHRSGVRIDQGVGRIALDAYSHGRDDTFVNLSDVGADCLRDEHRMAIDAMHRELDTASELYRPSQFWKYYENIHMEILRQEALERFKRTISRSYFCTLPSGDDHPQLQWMEDISDKDALSNIQDYRIIDPDKLSNGRLIRPHRRIFETERTKAIDRYRKLVSMLWEFASSYDTLKLTDRLSEPLLGEPIKVMKDGRLVSQDLANSIIEVNTILRSLKSPTDGALKVAEIGAGYGRLAYVMLQAAPSRYFIFDIAPALFISQWYISTLFPEKRVFKFRHFEKFADIEAELDEADIAFFTANQIELIPDGYFDVSINISSLHEMFQNQMENMLSQIYRVTGSRVFIKEYYRYENPHDGIVIDKCAYQVPDQWEVSLDRAAPTDPAFFEMVVDRQPPAKPTPRRRPLAAPIDYSPTVSILLANYNNAHFLPSSLAGIAAQSRSADEIILIDDGSTDDSVAVMKEYAEGRSNVTVLTSDYNRGSLSAIGRALDVAKGDYVVWAASDDLLLPNFVESSLAVLRRNPRAGLCFSALGVFVDGVPGVRTYNLRSHGGAFDLASLPEYLSPADFMEVLPSRYLWMSGNTVLARRDWLLRQGGFPAQLRWHADWLGFYLLALRHGACVVPDTLALMRERQRTYSRIGMQARRAQEKVLTSILDVLKSPQNADVLPFFQRCPSLLSLFGMKMVSTAFKSAHFDFGVRQMRYFLSRRYNSIQEARRAKAAARGKRHHG
ncbi:MAG: putative sugar O-methyltransferase [Hyphomicrobium sp.]|uniref:putative sugar O-methyltransferase n=1 Tax=Hyphomicrobium sp. TaxID=82 RepID=UPI00132222ED|nr:putative sugar O-methyltransferase [Hyphomicrobium sp.]KAB2939014.1 MAG: putative sugar O-methyltransferase [Hyphomicrobium sp.]MBZ0211757.1 putative sugar O-methyltransferase [Hyphomicrobium sp.]